MAGPSSVSGRYDGSIPSEAPTHSNFFGRIQELVRKVKEFVLTIFRSIENQYQLAKNSCKEFFAKVFTYLLDHVGNPLRNEIRLLGLELEQLKEQLQKREAELLEKIKELEAALEKAFQPPTPAPVAPAVVVSTPAPAIVAPAVVISTPAPAIVAPAVPVQPLLDEIARTKKELEGVRGQLLQAAAAVAKVEREKAEQQANNAQLNVQNAQLNVQNAQLNGDIADLQTQLKSEKDASSTNQIAIDTLRKQNKKLSTKLLEAQRTINAANPLMGSVTS